MPASPVQSLAKSQGFPRVSIYFPTHPTYPDSQQDPIRLSNALKEVERQLENSDWTSDEIADLLEEAQAFTEPVDFWHRQDHGLAVFIEDGQTQWFKLPEAVPELTVVASRYHVRPLLPLLQDVEQYYVLAVTADGAALFSGSKAQLHGLDVAGLPSGVEEIRGRTELQADVGYHGRDRGSAAGGADAPKYHALGESPEDYEETLLNQYLGEVANAIDHHLADRTLPLILAAVPRTLGRLRQALKYGNVLEDGVSSDPEAMDDEALGQASWKIAEDVVVAPREEARANLRAAIGRSPALFSRSPEEIFKAVDEGRVATLFLDRDETLWGHFDEDYRVVRIDQTSNAENEDLLNLLAIRTLDQGGEVRTLPSDVRSNHGPVAALFRY